MEKRGLKILNINDTCTGCGACMSACAKGALSMEYNEEGFYYPKLNPDLCIDCHFCEKSCHVINKPIKEEINRDFIPYMLKAKDDDLVKNSSSGGIFSLMANEILSKGGIVYGARYNFDKERLEQCSTDECSLDELRKSKYIESYLGDTFACLRKQLLSGRHVLFCGTPCQIKGLLTYLETRKTTTEKLITVRFICHGVPANKFFTEYKHWKEKKVGARITSLDFRPKTRGWKTSNIVLRFGNGKSTDDLHKEDYYYGYYYSKPNLLLRTCCYDCKQLHESVGDFTIADFWGIRMYDPSNKDNKGISLALVHTEKAKEMLGAISKHSQVEELPQSAVDYIYKDAPYKKTLLEKRASMMHEAIKIGYMPHAIKTLRGRIIKEKIKNYFKSILKKSGIWEIIRK